MRFVIYGAGAIGGVVGAKLHQAGFDVALIARGAHYRAIRDRGLTLEWPGGSAVLEIPVADSPEGIEWNGDEVVLLATKSQDTTGALDALRAVAPAGTPVVCMQNGVENERIALRLIAERVRRGGDVPDGASRAGDRPGVRHSGHGRDRSRLLPERP